MAGGPIEKEQGSSAENVLFRANDPHQYSAA